VETNDDVDATAWLDTIMDDINSEAEKGRVLIADTLDEVADWMGASRETVHSTIKEYNEYCRCGYDNDFLKDPEYLCPIVKPPFYVFTGYQGVDTCIGGIPVNHRQEVLREDRTPIPGLYAAGVCTSGWMGFTYGYFGSCMSYVIYSGYAAGENASKHIKE
jgi:fumarate reductase flavoprotein subunit